LQISHETHQMWRNSVTYLSPGLTSKVNRKLIGKRRWTSHGVCYISSALSLSVDRKNIRHCEKILKHKLAFPINFWAPLARPSPRKAYHQGNAIDSSPSVYLLILSKLMPQECNINLVYKQCK